MTRSTLFRFFEISFGTLAALALMLSPRPALAQHGGGGGHAGGGGGGHFGGGGGHASAGAGVGAAGHSSIGSHMSSLIHVFSGPRSAPVAPAHAAALPARSSNVSVFPSSSVPHGQGTVAEPGGSGAQRAMPMHTTIGFPPSTDPRFAPIASAHRGAPLSFSGQGQQIWQTSQPAAANRNSIRAIETRPSPPVFRNPPHLTRRPFLGGAPFFGSPGFIFFSPGFGFFGNGFGCDPFFTPSFGCGGFFPFGFGGFGGFGYLGYGGYFGDFGDAGFGYGYDNGYGNGYYPPPNYDVTSPNGADEGASEEPAPGPYLNPPAENSSPDNSGAESPITAPETVIYLKDGTSFAVKDYWVADGQLHYVTSYGGENSVNLNLFDLQRTTDENAKHGIAITLRPAPESQPPASQSSPPQPQPPAQPAPNPAPEGTPR